MQQPKMKVRYPVGVKLLASISILLFVTIFFLTFSAIQLLTDDKRAYTFQTQAIETRLAGKDFADTAQRSIEILRLMLGTAQAGGVLTPEGQKALQVNFDNQSTLVAASLWLAGTTESPSARSISQFAAPKAFENTGITSQDLIRMGDEIARLAPSLRSNPIAFTNLTRAGGSPLIGVLISDPQAKDASGSMPIALGVVRLDNSARSGGFRTTIANSDGQVLFDSDLRALYGKAEISSDPLFLLAKKSRLESSTHEYETPGGKMLGSFDKPGNQLIVLSRTSWDEAMASTYALVERFIWLGLIAVSASAVFAIFFAKTLTSPILRLYQAAQSVSRGDFEISLKPESRDELGALTEAFVTMSRKIAVLIQESVRKVQLENELAIASTVQQLLLPPKSFSDPRFEIRSHYQSAGECGGDWWGYFQMHGKLCIMIADATGHGLPSALITAAAQSCVSTISRFADENPILLESPARLLDYANTAIHGASGGTINMTFFLGVMDFKTRNLIYSSAGHNPPWLISAGDSHGSKVQSLVASGIRLGEKATPPPFEEKSIQVNPTDILFLYTDGILEGTNDSRAMFGKMRAMNIVKNHAKNGPESIIQELTKSFLAYNGAKPLDDDITLVTLQFR